MTSEVTPEAKSESRCGTIVSFDAVETSTAATANQPGGDENLKLETTFPATDLTTSASTVPPLDSTPSEEIPPSSVVVTGDQAESDLAKSADMQLGEGGSVVSMPPPHTEDIPAIEIQASQSRDNDGFTVASAPAAPAAVFVDVDTEPGGLDDFLVSPHGNNAIVERSPGGRYVRFMEKLGSGASKDVYRAYDTQEGIEVAWNVVHLAGVPKNERNRIVNEVRLLERLHHHNIISFHGSWVNRERQEVNFVTEILSSGTLKSFINKVQVIRWKIAKRWAVQILKGLEYLHSQDPPVIHRDLKCDNIFINGTSGDLRIGDLGLSTVHRNGKVMSVLGTPEFMAPDMYEENAYDERVDIYAFGMCILEIFTKEIPYGECNNPAQIYKKVTRGDPPDSLKRLKSKHAREFIELCLGYKGEDENYIRPSATELLEHPFLQKRPSDDDEVEVEPTLQEQTIGEGATETSSPGVSRGARPNDTSQNVAQAEPRKPSSPPKESYDRRNSLDEDESDRFDEMPDSEVNIRKVKVLMGRGKELKEDEPLKAPPAAVPGVVNALSDSTTQSAPVQPTQGVAASSNLGVESDNASVPANTQEQPSQPSLHYLVAAAVIENEPTNSQPYEDDILKLVVTLPVDGQTQNVQFDFHLVEDDPVQVAKEMVTELGIPLAAVLEISETISGLARAARMKQDKYIARAQQSGHHRTRTNSGIAQVQQLAPLTRGQSMPSEYITSQMAQQQNQHSQQGHQQMMEQAAPMHTQQMGQPAPIQQLQMQNQMKQRNSAPAQSGVQQGQPGAQDAGSVHSAQQGYGQQLQRHSTPAYNQQNSVQHVQRPPMQSAHGNETQTQASALSYGHPGQNHMQMQQQGMSQGMQVHGASGQHQGSYANQSQETQSQHQGMGQGMQMHGSAGQHPGSYSNQPHDAQIQQGLGQGMPGNFSNQAQEAQSQQQGMGQGIQSHGSAGQHTGGYVNQPPDTQSQQQGVGQGMQTHGSAGQHPGSYSNQPHDAQIQQGMGQGMQVHGSSGHNPGSFSNQVQDTQSQQQGMSQGMQTQSNTQGQQQGAGQGMQAHGSAGQHPGAYANQPHDAQIQQGMGQGVQVHGLSHNQGSFSNQAQDAQSQQQGMGQGMQTHGSAGQHTGGYANQPQDTQSQQQCVGQGMQVQQPVSYANQPQDAQSQGQGMQAQHPGGYANQPQDTQSQQQGVGQGMQVQQPGSYANQPQDAQSQQQIQGMQVQHPGGYANQPQDAQNQNSGQYEYSQNTSHAQGHVVPQQMSMPLPHGNPMQHPSQQTANQQMHALQGGQNQGYNQGMAHQPVQNLAGHLHQSQHHQPQNQQQHQQNNQQQPQNQQVSGHTQQQQQGAPHQQQLQQQGVGSQHQQPTFPSQQVGSGGASQSQPIVSSATSSKVISQSESTGASAPGQIQLSSSQDNMVPPSDYVSTSQGLLNGVLGVPAIENEDDLMDDDLLATELRKLDEDFKKNMARAKRVFEGRMDKMQLSQAQREELHQKTLERHQKERADFEKRLQMEEIEQNRRIEQLQMEWDRRREAVRKQKLEEASVSGGSDELLSSSPQSQPQGNLFQNPNGGEGNNSER